MKNNAIVFATNNSNKVNEIRAVIGSLFTIITLQEAGIDIDIPEPHDTLEANASEKSQTIFRITGKDCFSEDTGLEVAALGGEPGVKSARYAGEGRDFQANIDKLIQKLEGAKDRSAQFRTVVSLIVSGKEYFFEGVCRGKILPAQKGLQGFGYDPVFVPEGSDKTFAEMSLDEKNQFSHRKKAVAQLIQFLKTHSE